MHTKETEYTHTVGETIFQTVESYRCDSMNPTNNKEPDGLSIFLEYINPVTDLWNW